MAATTPAASARVTLGERDSRPFTTREKREGGEWFREKNGRQVLRIHDGKGSCKYWRAPRPRPRPHRRATRRRNQCILQQAVAEDSQLPDSAEVIRVLQHSLHNVLRRAEVVEQKLQGPIAKSAQFSEQVATGVVAATLATVPQSPCTESDCNTKACTDSDCNTKAVQALRGQFNATMVHSSV